MVCRGGGFWISRDGLSEYNQLTDRRVYPDVKGRFEDPVIWRDPVSYTHLDVYKRQGEARLIAVDNGDHMTDELFSGNHKKLHQGFVMAILLSLIHI